MILSYPSDQDPPLHSLTLSAHSCLSLSLPSHCILCSPTHCPQPTTVPLSLPPPNPTQPRLTVRAASPRMAVRLRPVTLRTMIDPPPTTPRVSTFSVSLAPTLTRGLCLSLTLGLAPNHSRSDTRWLSDSFCLRLLLTGAPGQAREIPKRACRGFSLCLSLYPSLPLSLSWRLSLPPPNPHSSIDPLYSMDPPFLQKACYGLSTVSYAFFRSDPPFQKRPDPFCRVGCSLEKPQPVT